MHSPLISIIIPVYNVEQYLRQCLDSIVQQSFTNYEVILVDDGSSDGSPAICDEYAERYSQVKTVHKTNGGVSSARNAGLDIAKGTWIWFVDADDYVVENSLNILDSFIQEHNCDTVLHGLVFLKNDVIIKNDNHDADFSPKNSFLLKNFVYQNGMILFKSSIIKNENLRFIEGVKMGEDLEFQYRYLFFCKTPMRLSCNLYVYRLREGSAVSNPQTHINNMWDSLANVHHIFYLIHRDSNKPEEWLVLRIRNLIKTGMQSALFVDSKELKGYNSKLKSIVREILNSDYCEIIDNTIRLACVSVRLYVICLRAILFLKGTNKRNPF